MSDEPDLWAKLYGDRQGEPLTAHEQRLVEMVDDIRKRDKLTKLAGTGMTVEVKNPRLDALEKRLERIEAQLGADYFEDASKLPSCSRCRGRTFIVAAASLSALIREVEKRDREVRRVAGPFKRTLADSDTGVLREQWYYYVEKVGK